MEDPASETMPMSAISRAAIPSTISMGTEQDRPVEDQSREGTPENRREPPPIHQQDSRQSHARNRIDRAIDDFLSWRGREEHGSHHHPTANNSDTGQPNRRGHEPPRPVDHPEKLGDE
jgi:hypothetical protein